MSAPKPISQEFIATMDARILLLSNELPSHLQFRPGQPNSESSKGLPAYVQRQVSILYLRINHLRLLLRREEMLTLKYHPRTADTAVKIAANSINAIYTRHNSPYRQPTERYSSVLYITGALIPLICVIVNDEKNDKIKAIATDSFRKATTVLEDIAPGLGFARNILRQLRSSLVAVNQAIAAKWPMDIDKQSKDGRQVFDGFGSGDGAEIVGSPGIGVVDGGAGMQDLDSNSFMANLANMGNLEQFRTPDPKAFDSSYWDSQFGTLGS